ncbi:glycoside hydrolase family 68 protein [Acinetobacter sp. HY1485]|uniref:glycoside hydrolase family 68 protein n=1 Tax=Acinetobacter sp. HY1485 TaxID=2970918 RepID=UPI0022B9A426|nr:glycoside hydrolase family 68 protein [Acinetobacter sp. HY1485]
MAQYNYQPTIWTRADALKVHEDDPTTTQPLVPANFPIMDNRLFIWDTMPLRTLDGTIVSIDGWSVIFTLTAVRDPKRFTDKNGKYDITADWEDRHGRARICFWYSRDGKSWKFGGRVMKEGVSPTSREWAGTPILLNNNGDVDLYYTCVTPGATICKVRGRLVASQNGVTVENFTKVKSLFEADGTYYQTEKQNPYFNFRDPSPFIDPVDGKLYMVFEGNVAGDRGSHIVGDAQIGKVPPQHTDVGGARFQVGCIGLAVATDLTGDQWEILPPLVTAVGVNDQTERPHYVFKDGKYYLFTISHKFTYADGLSGPDGVYGFVSENLTGPYRPMNSSGLVLGNPSSQPYQTYSHYVMPNGLVTSFIDSVPVPTPNPKDLQYRIGGTEAPTVRIELEGDRSFLIETLDYGYIPPMQNVKLRKRRFGH